MKILLHVDTERNFKSCYNTDIENVECRYRIYCERIVENNKCYQMEKYTMDKLMKYNLHYK
jgi:hypothetical protein